MNLYQVKVGYSKYPMKGNYLVVAEDKNRAISLMKIELSGSEVGWHIKRVIHKFEDLTKEHIDLSR